MVDYTKSIKGQRGFSKMYQILGDCKTMRVPLTVYDKIKCILSLFEEIQDLDKVHTILDKNIIGLENLVKNRIESEEDECDSLTTGTDRHLGDPRVPLY